jgi:tRNA pseudouridine55 synthase
VGKIKRGATDLSGIIAIDKPAGMTSHDVVSCLRRITGEGRIGHAGTLDPAATGLLLLCVGPATRLSDLIMASSKTYVARVVFGSATDTDDAEGVVIETAPIPAKVSDPEYARMVLTSFIGEQEQMPPHYSAIKKEGVKAYQLARKGKTPQLDPRTITIYELHLLELGDNYWDIECSVSKGTYIRSLARDIGEAVGTKAHVGSLRRTRSGAISVERAHELGELKASADALAGDATSTALADYVNSLFLDPVKDLGIEGQKIPEGLRN